MCSACFGTKHLLSVNKYGIERWAFRTMSAMQSTAMDQCECPRWGPDPIRTRLLQGLHASLSKLRQKQSTGAGCRIKWAADTLCKIRMAYMQTKLSYHHDCQSLDKLMKAVQCNFMTKAFRNRKF